eukprot:GHRR01008372.1.p1 GENE.GHRR01008372.1~~GHRR01008372.1.p1  ORF type:complete len:235 (+),score=97.59 GHRR01008372.1:141-845(+)
MESLMGLPDRGCFGVMGGARVLQQAQTTYICYDNNVPVDGIVRNANQKLIDSYSQAHKRSAVAATKRQTKWANDRENKRHQPDSTVKQPAAEDGPGPLSAALAAVAGKGAAATVPPSAAPGRIAATAPTAARQPLTATASGKAGNGDVNSNTVIPGSLQQRSNIMMQQSRPAGGNSHRQVVYTADQLKCNTNKELVELLKARNCPVSGKKDELIRRLLDYQRRLKRAAQGVATS